MKILNCESGVLPYCNYTIYTLQEVIDIICGECDYNNVETLKTLCHALKINNNATLIESDIVTTLWMYIFNRYMYQNCIMVSNISNNVDNVQNEAIYFFQKLLNVIDRTYKKYSTLINLYETQKDSLLKQLETTSSSLRRFNDTPQDEGTFEDDAHTTDLTEISQTTKSDTTTPILRLKEIENNLSDYYKNWVDEFNILFLPME